MFFDFAPMEGITGSAFRQVHRRHFSGVDRYYTPFLSPTKDHRFTPREQREFFPDHDQDLCVIPQILTKVPEDFLWAAQELHAMGYPEVNLNLGCPSGTVTAKGKGCGLLADPDALDRFLQAIFDQAPCPISVKTRLGLEQPEEFEAILSVYNRYPISELIIHPRVRKDFYRHPIRQQMFDWAMEHTALPISFNGGLITTMDCRSCQTHYPHLRAVMVGQALVSNPFLGEALHGGPPRSSARLRAFHDELFETYATQFGNRLNAAKRMKELWFYLIRLFPDSERYGKQIFKASSPEAYANAVSAVFQDLPLLDESTGGW